MTTCTAIYAENTNKQWVVWWFRPRRGSNAGRCCRILIPRHTKVPAAPGIFSKPAPIRWGGLATDRNGFEVAYRVHWRRDRMQAMARKQGARYQHRRRDCRAARQLRPQRERRRDQRLVGAALASPTNHCTGDSVSLGVVHLCLKATTGGAVPRPCLHLNRQQANECCPRCGNPPICLQAGGRQPPFCENPDCWSAPVPPNDLSACPKDVLVVEDDRLTAPRCRGHPASLGIPAVAARQNGCNRA